MDRITRHIRQAIVKTVNDSTYPINYKGWLDEWYDNHGKFARLKEDGRAQLAHLSIGDSIISIVSNINSTRYLPSKQEPVWVVYWRNVIVDRQNKRIAFPRFRGRYLQIDQNATIPQGNYYAEISVDIHDNISLRFVLGGNLPPKYEPIEGKHNRGRHRRNTREPRTKTFD